MRLTDLDNPKVRHLLCNLDKKVVPGRELNNEGWFEELGGFIEELLEIADAEPIDAVPVVRCKDCKYWCSELADIPLANGKRFSSCARSNIRPNEDFYCGFGERNTDGTDDH